MSQRGEIITFYSYKGGTGRTMALANTAVLLGARRSRVLVMDWDLEAPGLHRFFPSKADDARRSGTIDLLEDLAARVPAAPEPLEEEETDALLRGLDVAALAQPAGRDNVDLLWAGNADEGEYAHRISRLDWDGLYGRAPYLFPALARRLAQQYDYVLVDSRTGLSDTSGTCTVSLPDKLVVVFSPNRQSLDGALLRARNAVEYRRRSGDLRSLLVYPLASRVELSEDELRKQWRYGDGDGTPGYQPSFESLFKDIYDLEKCDLKAWFDEVQIQHSTRHAYGETIAVGASGLGDRLSIARSYDALVRGLAQDAGPWEIQASSASPARDERERERLALARLQHEARWHERCEVVGRRRLLMLRLMQLGTMLLTAVRASIEPYPEYRWYWVAGGVTGVLLLEALLDVFGATFWRRHGRLAQDLRSEERRYVTRTRVYAGEVDAPRVLAEQLEDITEDAYRNWPVRPVFGTLARDPRPPPEPPSLVGPERAQLDPSLE